MIIRTAETEVTAVAGLPAAEWVCARSWINRDVPRFHPEDVAVVAKGEVTAVAEVNRGRWVVRCPFCMSAQYASRIDRRFFCVECLNEKAGRRFVRVVWPDEETVTEVEALLTARPEKSFASWVPGTPLETLASENAAGFHHSWTTPMVWVVSQVVTAAEMNEQVSGNLNETLPARAVDAIIAAQVFG
jgi:hypothetical protein